MARIFYTLILCMGFSLGNAQDASLGLNYEIINGEIEVNWQKPEAFKSHFFELQKLDDENKWSGIHFIRPKVDQELFSSTDHAPTDGINSFRIKMKTRYGEVKFSETIDVFFESLSFDLLVYPNPANAWLVINADKPNTTYTVNLIDRYGNTVLTGETDESSCVLETSQVIEGMYFIKVDGEGASFKKAIVINHR